MKLSRTSLISVVACCAAALVLTSCAATDTPAPASSTSATEVTPTAAAGKTVSAKALCDYLRGEVPKLKESQSDLLAMTNLTVNLFNWYDSQGLVPDSVQIEALTLEECPEVRTEVLKIAGIDSFTAL